MNEFYKQMPIEEFLSEHGISYEMKSISLPECSEIVTRCPDEQCAIAEFKEKLLAHLTDRKHIIWHILPEMDYYLCGGSWVWAIYSRFTATPTR